MTRKKKGQLGALICKKSMQLIVVLKRGRNAHHGQIHGATTYGNTIYMREEYEAKRRVQNGGRILTTAKNLQQQTISYHPEARLQQM